jgi:hypothetical protein
MCSRPYAPSSVTTAALLEAAFGEQLSVPARVARRGGGPSGAQIAAEYALSQRLAGCRRTPLRCDSGRA